MFFSKDRQGAATEVFLAEGRGEGRSCGLSENMDLGRQGVDSGKAHPKVGDQLGPTMGSSRQGSRHTGKVCEWPPRSTLNPASTL